MNGAFVCCMLDRVQQLCPAVLNRSSEDHQHQERNKLHGAIGFNNGAHPPTIFFWNCENSGLEQRCVRLQPPVCNEGNVQQERFVNRNPFAAPRHLPCYWMVPVVHELSKPHGGVHADGKIRVRSEEPSCIAEEDKTCCDHRKVNTVIENLVYGQCTKTETWKDIQKMRGSE